MPIYLISALNPLEGVIKKYIRSLLNSLGKMLQGSKKRLVAWDTLCLFKDEGGLGLISLKDTSNALFAKLWWNFRTSTNLWSVYVEQIL